MKKIIITETQLKKIVDKVLNEQPKPTHQGTTGGPDVSKTPAVPNLVGKTVNLYSDPQNGKFFTQVKIKNVEKTREGKVIIYLATVGGGGSNSLTFNCSNPNKNQFNYLEPVSRKFVLVYNTPLATQLRKLLCTVNASGTTVPKADFASNTQKPTSDFA